MRTPFTGVGTALVTPFTLDGSLDTAAVSRLARRQLDAGVHVLVPCGTTGETPTLSVEEKRRVIELVAAEAKGRALVLAGAGGYDTKEVIHLAAVAAAAGADGLLSVTPYYNKPTPEGLYQHYKAIADSTELPIVVYNVPGRTGCNVDPATLVRLATIPNIIGVKEASGNITQMAEILRAVPDDFIVMSGDDAITLPLMAMGGHGIISVMSNEMPAELVQLVEAFEQGAVADAQYWHNKLLPLMQVNFIEANPGPVKFAMAAMGLCEEVYRLPMVSPRPSSQEKILAVMRDLGLPIVAGAGAGAGAGGRA
ncbi:MAG: 4-hydroxy-tetrahydrodipicolinate synthase [Acidobacteria bacterium]|nr:4-hydroxy-tetrahydrodipicolinate synthase [Acidobacteriota bacterium]